MSANHHGSTIPDRRLAVFGAGGGVGHMVVQFATAMGFKVIGIDLGDDKSATAKEAGAKEFVDVSKVDDVGAAVKKLTEDGMGAHACVVAAGNPKAYATAPAVLRPLGQIIAVGLRKSTSERVADLKLRSEQP